MPHLMQHVEHAWGIEEQSRDTMLSFVVATPFSIGNRFLVSEHGLGRAPRKTLI